MIFKEHEPQFRVGNYVDMIWYAETDQMFSGNEKILPDGSVQIIINLGPVQYLADGNSRKAFKEGWITGQRTRSIEVEVTADYRAIGIIFTSTGVFPFLGFPASELTDEVVELEDIWQNEFTSLRDKLLELPGIEEKFLMVEQFLLHRLLDTRDPHAAIHYAAILLQNSASESSIQDTAGKMNISHKHLIRLFKKHVGLSPKLYQRIFRFQHILNALNKPDSDFSTILQQTDYYDQSHFNREFKQFSGMTPNEYVSILKADTHSLILE